MALIVCLLQQSSKLTILQWGLQENSTRSPHYIIHYLYTWLLVRATTIFIWPLSSCVILMSITHSHVFFLRPPCFLHVPWCYTFNLCCTCAHHVYTMRNPCPLMSLLTLTPSRLFPILLDSKSFQTALDSVTWLPGHVPISYLSFIVD